MVRRRVASEKRRKVRERRSGSGRVSGDVAAY
jgi:hypothetical protein